MCPEGRLDRPVAVGPGLPRHRPWVRLLTTWLAVGCSVLLRALTICGQCGHEQPGRANFCTHCGAAVRMTEGGSSRDEPVAAPVAEEEAPVRPVGPDDKPLELVRDAVLQDVNLGRELLAEGRAEVARAVLANALALSAVEPAALSTAQGEQLMIEIRQCEQQLVQATMACPACQGSGRRSLRFETLTGESHAVAATGGQCLTCRGSGQIRRNRSIDDLKFLLGQAARQSEQALRARGRVPVGGAWIPPALQPLLTVESEARLRRAAAAPCTECQGIGRADCRRCGNTGFTPCTARGCEQGLTVRQDLNVLDSRSAIRRRETCGTCGGSARVPCTDCRGAGALTCRVCNGDGKRPNCPRCAGDGLAECRTCRGSGLLRDNTPCGDCEGGGRALCPVCRGDGFRGR